MKITRKTTASLSFSRFLALLLSAVMLFGFSMSYGAFALTENINTVKVGFFAMDGYHMQDENGKRSGYGYDFLQYVARYSNLRFEYIGYDCGPFEMLEMLENGEIDLLTSIQPTAELNERFAFSSTLIGTSATVLSEKAGTGRFSDGNYSGMRIGLIKGDVRNELLSEFMKERGFEYTPVYFRSPNEITKALQQPSDRIIDAAMTTSLRRSENEWTLEQLGSAPYYAVVRKDDTELLSQLNSAILRMDTDAAGWRTKLLNKYYSMDSGDVVDFTADERGYLDSLKRSRRILSVTMCPDNAPYSYFEDGEPKGIIYDIFKETALRMGIDFTMCEPSDSSEYRQLCIGENEKKVDVILDGIDDLSTIEEMGLEISDVYYSTPLAILTTKSSASEVKTLARPTVNPLNETHYSHIFDSRTLISKEYSNFNEICSDIKKGVSDGAFMPYYCAQWLANSDVTGKLKCLMTPKYERSFVFAVVKDEDYELLSALNKAVKSLSEDKVASIVAKDTEYSDNVFSFLGFMYKNIVLVTWLAVLFIAVVAVAFLFANQSRRAKKELRRTRRLERYIGYLCDMYYKVLEVDIDKKSRIQYMKRNGRIEIEEQKNFTSFDIGSIHPDDKKLSLEVFDSSAIKALAASGKDECYIESRMKSDNGEYRWYEFLLKLIPKDKEHPCSAVLLIKDVDSLHRERERNHSELISALDAANSASRSKSTFLSSMSHEIRTPLNAMIGYMTIASTAIDNKEKVSHCIESAGIAARHLLSIINDVLDISAMESGKMKLAKDRFDLKEQLSTVSTLFYQQCKQKNIQFEISIDGLTEEWVIGDSLRVNQILMNLMSNAVKFTEHGKVSLTVVQKSMNAKQVYIRFIVRDTGIGMSKEYLNKLFTPFEQESTSTARKYGGTGLGMSITFNLVSLMGGKINVESEQGKGTIFTVTLPFECTDNKNTALKAEKMNFSNLRVLIVDDLQNECDYIHALLDRSGVKSETAANGEDALRLVAKRKGTNDKFNLCIIDWNMPGLNGVETTRLIHKECDPDIPIIIATAYDIAEFQDEAISAGAMKIVSKPLFQSTLLDLLVTTYGKYETIPNNEDDIPNLTGMHVLLAEDNETNVEVAVDLLEIVGVTADIAANGKQAYDLFIEKGDSYDAILMDVQMPIMDGYAATKAIRESRHASAKTIPIIALTADAFAENIASSLSAGMNDHVAKPIETKILFSVLKKFYKK